MLGGIFAMHPCVLIASEFMFVVCHADTRDLGVTAGRAGIAISWRVGGSDQPDANAGRKDES